MRILYFIFKYLVKYAAVFYYPRQKFVNEPKKFFGRTIFVSNHAASFMDPIMIGGLGRPIIFFLTRSDVFTAFTRPILWAFHMLPIYRQQDGEDTQKRNEEVFQKCAKILTYGRNLLIFGEGFTDDVFIRRLKPVKKGAIRIGFIALENTNWKKKIYVAGVGINYSDPNRVGSDYLISYSDRILLNDYKEAYLANPHKTIADLTKVVEKLMKEQITHVEKASLAPFHEQLMIITRKGMNPIAFDRKLSLRSRWNYSRKLANWMNEADQESPDFIELHHKTTAYFNKLKKIKLHDDTVYWKIKSSRQTKDVLTLIALIPFMLVGLIHCFLPYYLTKRFVESKFRRRVFWGSVKIVLGLIFMGIVNLPMIFLFHHFVYPSWWFAIAYYVLIGFFGFAAYQWFRILHRYRVRSKARKMQLEELISERKEIKRLMNEIVILNA